MPDVFAGDIQIPEIPQIALCITATLVCYILSTKILIMLRTGERF